MKRRENIEGESGSEYLVQEREHFLPGGVVDFSRFTRRVLSTVRIWSKTICPDFRWNLTAIRVGYSRPCVVMGATITVPIFRSSRRERR